VSESFIVIGKLFAIAIAGSKNVSLVIGVATLRVAETLLEMVLGAEVSDISRLKESLIERIEAETVSQKADSMRKLAEAIEATNKANLHKRKDALAVAERDIARAQAAKTQEEADAIKRDSETRRIEAIAKARTDFIEAISKLKQEGGEIVFDAENLRALLNSGSQNEPPIPQPSAT
jgi:hypothetical protein